MSTPYHRIGRNAHRLPAGYFADAPTLPLAGQPTVASHNSPHGTTGASPALAKPAPADDTADGRQGTLSEGGNNMEAGSMASAINGDAEAGNGPIPNNSTAGGVTTSGALLPVQCGSRADRRRFERAQQLHAARIIFGKQTR